MRQKLILLSGIPASGKSSYGQWLAREKGFLHLDVEKNGVLAKAGLEPVFHETFQSRDVMPFVRTLRSRERHVAVDWGFPPHCLWVIQALGRAGVDLWWFDGDREAARKAFLKRGTVAVANLDRQMGAIERAWPDIASTFGTHILRTVAAGPSYLAWSDVFAHMFGA